MISRKLDKIFLLLADKGIKSSKIRKAFANVIYPPNTINDCVLSTQDFFSAAATESWGVSDIVEFSLAAVVSGGVFVAYWCPITIP